MQEILSLQNPVVKLAASLLRKKSRQETGLFLIEGHNAVKEAVKSNLEITHIFLNKKNEETAKFFPKENLYLVNEKILEKISDVENPQGIIAVAKQFKYDLKDLIACEDSIIIVLENINDPGNLGTIIRTAKAADASGILLAGECSDIFNPKTVRASSANLWKIPIIYIEDFSELKGKFKNFQFIGTGVNSYKIKKNCYEADYKKPSVIFFGAESQGLSEKLSNQVDFSVKIPMNPEVESLNLSVSAAVILYEALRQRCFYTNELFKK